jgi:valyl-tRNA synthetase
MLKQSIDFQTYHPTTVMETGYDILFFWVARMILATTFMTGQIPFKTVYLHGMVLAEDGKKMSKSRPESIIDPLKVIPEYGTDALRMALIGSIAPGADQSWSTPKIQSTRNFCNKLWNIARFIEDKLGDDYKERHAPQPKQAADHWIMHSLAEATKSINTALDQYRFSDAFDTLYHTVWDDFADWYIEASKTDLNPSVLAYGLETILKLAHPFAPFVTETIWQTLAWEPDSILAMSPKNTVAVYDKEKAAEFKEIMTIVSESRTIVANLSLRKSTLYYNEVPFLADNAELIARLSGLSGVKEVASGHGLHLTNTRYTCWLDVDSNTAAHYVNKLREKLAAHEAAVARLKGRLSSESYVKNAPKKLVEETRAQLTDAEATIGQVAAEIERFASLSK